MLLQAVKIIVFLLVLSGLNLFNSAKGQSLPPASRSDSLVFMLNEKAVHMIRHQYGEPHIRFLALHDTEKTGLKAAFRFIGINGGCAIELQYGRVRNIDFTDSLQDFSFDPNNMFTYEGAYIGLARNSVPRIHDGVTEKVRKLADEVLKFSNIDSLGSIVTLHNNYDGGFSIYSYTQGNYLESTASDVYINSEMDADDFVFVTDKRFFDYLKQRKINVVLQSSQAPDDGSLSVFAMLGNIPYANIEVQHGHLTENYQIILSVNDMLKEFSTEFQSTKQD